jgi:hypothetical protein
VKVATYLLSLPLAIIAGLTARPGDWAERRIIANGRPLTEAIQKFAAEHGAPPQSLSQLVPRYLPKLPETGTFNYPEFEIKVCDRGDGNCFGDRWMIYANAKDSLVRGFSGCDQYIFAPSGQYPNEEVDAFCHYAELSGGWAREYGD